MVYIYILAIIKGLHRARAQAEAVQVKIVKTARNFDILTAILRTSLFAARDSKPSGCTDEDRQLERDPWRRADA